MANPTTNYGFVLPTSTDLVTDLPADFDVALQGVDTRLKALQPGTTLGDIAYSSATANTNTRLPIGSNGQVLSIAAGVPAWATAASGMNLISTTALSAVTSQSINSVFSSTYTNYLILFTLDSSGANGGSVDVRLRASGTDATGSNYFRAGYLNAGGAAQNVSSTITSFSLGTTNTTGQGAGSITLFNPNLAAYTQINAQYTAFGDTTFIYSGQHTVSTAYDGFTIYSTQTMTGKVSVYGYSK